MLLTSFSYVLLRLREDKGFNASAPSIVRYKRQQGYDVRFQTGTDEHGQKVELKAAEKGVTPKEFRESKSQEIQQSWICRTCMN